MGATSTEARTAAGVEAARVGAAAGWIPWPGTPGQPGLGAAGATLVKVPRESVQAGCGWSLGATRPSPRSDNLPPAPALLFPPGGM